MSSLRRGRHLNILIATASWIAVAYSVGWYNTLTRMGAKQWPLPSPETASAQLATFIAWDGFHPAYERVWWFALFPICGFCWIAFQTFSAPYFDGRHVTISEAARSFALAALPIAAMGPVVAYYIYQRRGEFLFETFYLRAVEFGLVEPEPWLGPGYLILAAASVVIQFFVHNHVFAIPPTKAPVHFIGSAAASGLACLGFALIARYFGESLL